MNFKQTAATLARRLADKLDGGANGFNIQNDRIHFRIAGHNSRVKHMDGSGKTVAPKGEGYAYIMDVRYMAS